MTEAATQAFHYREAGGEGCTCPIHAGRSREPFTAPLGLRFADRVGVDTIGRERAAAVYAAHHGYMADVPSVNLEHHGLYYRGELLGAVTYRFPLISRKKLRFDTNGELLPEPLDAGGVPEPLRSTFHRVMEPVDESDVDRTEVVPGDCIVEAARICLGARMPNLASASLARSQELLVHNQTEARGIRFLLTFVRADYDGAMIRALRDKGWTCTGLTRPRASGNREETPIRRRCKWCFVCPVETVREQTELGRWST